MAGLSASEASTFSHAFCAFLGGELFESNDVDFHGIRVVRGSSRREVWGSEVGGSSSSSDLINA